MGNGASTSPDKRRATDCLRPSPTAAAADGNDDDAQRSAAAGCLGTTAVPDAAASSSSEPADSATCEYGCSTCGGQPDMHHRRLLLLHHQHRGLGARHGDVTFSGSGARCSNGGNTHPHPSTADSSNGYREAGAEQPDCNRCVRSSDSPDCPAGST